MKKLFKKLFRKVGSNRQSTPATNAPKETKGSGFSDDAALTATRNDQLGRASFAKQIARNLATMSTPENTVIGIYGGWGEGKTTLLNFISSELKDEFDTIVVWFNPWRLPDEEALLELFFNELRQALGHIRNDSVKKICGSLDRILGEFDQSITTKFMRHWYGVTF